MRATSPTGTISRPEIFVLATTPHFAHARQVCLELPVNASASESVTNFSLRCFVIIEFLLTLYRLKQK
jgi:hypothetical protein